MFTLTNRFDDKIEIEDEAYNLDLSFDNVLRILELFNDDEYPPYDRLLYAYEMLVIDGPEINDPETLDKIIYRTYKEALGIDFKDQTPQTERKVMDMYEDASYIYASFLQDYNIDLIEMQGKLHYKKFQALLNGLTEKTKLKEVIGIRTMEIPRSTKHNSKQRESIIKMKRAYRLKGSTDPHLVADKVDTMFDNLATFVTKQKGG